MCVKNTSFPKELYIKRPIYIDTLTCKGNTLKVTNNKDVCRSPQYLGTHDEQCNYYKLQEILNKQFDNDVSIEEATLIGTTLLNIYEVLLS